MTTSLRIFAIFAVLLVCCSLALAQDFQATDNTDGHRVKRWGYYGWGRPRFYRPYNPWHYHGGWGHHYGGYYGK